MTDKHVYEIWHKTETYHEFSLWTKILPWLWPWGQDGRIKPRMHQIEQKENMGSFHESKW